MLVETNVQNGQKIVLHSQNAIIEDVGKALDNNKRKRAARLKRMVSWYRHAAKLTNRTS